MPDFLSTAWATPGLIWLVMTIAVAGIVRGFAGFGTALIFVPIANIFLSATDVVAVTMLTGLGSMAALLPRALKTAEIKDVSLMGAAAILTVPFGLWLLYMLDQVTIRWAATIIATVMLTALVFGWRYKGLIDATRMLGIGATAGVFGGMTGLTGPVVILFYLASGARAAIVRANTILFLAMLDVVIILNMLVSGLLTLRVLGIAIVLTVPYFLSSKVGQSMFSPDYEKIYRAVAYGVIALAVLTGLPIWSEGH
ncbi:TSUP family transporter [Cognatishimia sp. WU-CL00825]|uniref:TSUP family transporter n=1 Tax=Cognatishimia sp. WU-CL00825 TaxID=3127658 RepID=UPI0033659738